MRNDPTGIMGWMDDYIMDESNGIDKVLEELPKESDAKPEEKTLNTVTQNYLAETGKYQSDPRQ